MAKKELKNNHLIIKSNNSDKDIFVFSADNERKSMSRYLDTPCKDKLSVGDISTKNNDWILIEIRPYVFGTIYVWKNRTK